MSQDVSIQHVAPPAMCNVPWPIQAKNQTLPLCAVVLSNQERVINPASGKCGYGCSYSGRILTTDGEKSIEVVIWGPPALRPTLAMGVPYVVAEARFKGGNVVYNITRRKSPKSNCCVMRVYAHLIMQVRMLLLFKAQIHSVASVHVMQVLATTRTPYTLAATTLLCLPTQRSSRTSSMSWTGALQRVQQAVLGSVRR